MVFGYPTPWWAILLIIVATALVAWASYARPVVPMSRRQQTILTVLRFAILILLLTILLGPIVVEPSSVARETVVPILVDVSRSMRVADAGGSSRLERAREILADQVVPALGQEFQVDLLAFGEALAPTDTDALHTNGRWSDLTGALAEVRDRYSDRDIPGVVVISDGGDTSGREGAGTNSAGTPPVYAIGVGSTRITRDREVLSLTAGRAALADSVIGLSATIVNHGFGTAPVELRVLANGRPVEARRVSVPADGSPVRATFRVSPSDQTATLYTVEIPRAPGELVPENNSRSVLVRPPGTRRRVLLVEGAPGFEHSFLKRTLTKDPGLEVDSVVRKGQNDRGDDTFYVQAGAPRTAALSKGFPEDREGLFGYDALILGNIEGHTLTGEQIAMAADFVSIRGGGLLVLGALSFASRGLVGTRLEEVLPVELTGRGGVARRTETPRREPNTVDLTVEGAAHPMMWIGASERESKERWAELPALAAVTRVGAPRPGASVLAVSAGPGGWESVVAVQPYGRGRAMVFAGEASWRWRMMLPSENRTYETFWRQVVRWLAAETPRPISATVSGGAIVGEPVTLAVDVRDHRFEPIRDASVEVHLTGPGGTARSVRAVPAGAPGRYEARLQPDERGAYQVTIEAEAARVPVGTLRDWVLIGGTDAELADPRLNDGVLRRLAAASGGRFVEEDEIADLTSWLRAETDSSAPPVHRDLWHNVWVFLAVVALLSSEWTLRRRWGLR